MKSTFSKTLSKLRREKKFSQSHTAAALGVSQALLSHYENGIREPKLEFVIKVCDYYGVTADYLLGRTGERDGGTSKLRESFGSLVDLFAEQKAAESMLMEKMKQLIKED
jgi:transcriptional regulator with XRE-family HTH domain